jgi:hypothetical protein
MGQRWGSPLAWLMSSEKEYKEYQNALKDCPTWSVAPKKPPHHISIKCCETEMFSRYIPGGDVHPLYYLPVDLRCYRCKQAYEYHFPTNKLVKIPTVVINAED